MATTTEITELINAFRKITQSRSISPESVGAILQHIVDALAQTAPSLVVESLRRWSEMVQDSNPAITGLSQTLSDRNEIKIDARRKPLNYNGETDETDTSGYLVIKQATTERAGAMRAQQVTDLNTCKSDIKAMQSDLETALEDLGDLARFSEVHRERLDAHDSEIDGIQATLTERPWLEDTHVYFIKAQVYSLGEGTTNWPDIYYSIQQKKFFTRHDGVVSYDVPLNTTDADGNIVPRKDCVFVCSNGIAHFESDSFKWYATRNDYDALKDRVTALENTLKAHINS